MKIECFLSDEAVLSEIGRRIQRQRLDQNVTQAAVARVSGVSTPTVQRLEGGSSVQLVSLLRILRALGLLEQIETLVPPPSVRPMELLEREGQRRRRASREQAAEPGRPWSWED